MIGKAYISTTPFYDSRQRRMSFKQRPVLIIGRADNNDYVVLPISRVTNTINLNSCYDLPISPIDVPLMNLQKQSYIRTHKQCIIHQKNLIKEITDFRNNYEQLFVEVLSKVNQFQKSIIDNAL